MNSDQPMLLWPCLCGETLHTEPNGVLDCCYAKAVAFLREHGATEPPEGWEAYLRRDAEWHEWADEATRTLGDETGDR